jgi:serine/threonine protein phosphatase PrpC
MHAGSQAQEPDATISAGGGAVHTWRYAGSGTRAEQTQGPAEHQEPVPLHEGTVTDAPGTGSSDAPDSPLAPLSGTIDATESDQPATPPRPSGEGAASSPPPPGRSADSEDLEDDAESGPASAAPADRDQPMAPELEEHGPAAWEPLAPGTLLAERYLVRGPLTDEEAARLLGEPVSAHQAELYAVDDQRGYERCWSCGSTNNTEQQRFCTDCGAPLQNRQTVLARTSEPAGESEEFADGGAWYHLVQPRKQFGSAGITIEVGGYSAEGPHHPNEDSYWSGIAGGCYDSTSEMFGVVALADGMGGYAPGSGLISKEIVQTIGHGIFSILQAEQDLTLEETDLQAIIRGAVAQANSGVLAQIEQHGDMGSTLVTAVIYGPAIYIANIGDSRAYYISPAGAVTQITRDQSLIEQQVAAGLLSPDAVYTAIGNNVILHAIGEESVEDAADWYSHPLEPGSHLLLCSDGYWKTMAHDVWDPELAHQQPTLRALARAMVEQALAQGSDDNTTVVIVGID